MYRQLYGFTKHPFRHPADPERLFLGRHHEEALAHLTYAVMEGEGFTVITGDSGVGKTAVSRSFVKRLHRDAVAAYITATAGLSPLQLLKNINAAYKLQSDLGTIKDLTDGLNDYLIAKKRADKKVALFIDDAHLLSDEALEQVRLLSNLETTRDKLLQIVLIGRPTLSEMLATPSLRQIGQRVSVNYFINPLDAEETAAYVQHRISISSAGPPVRFDQAALRTVHKHAQGIPRQINSACDRILTLAAKSRERTIGDKTAKAALAPRQKEPRTLWPAVPRRYLPLFYGTALLMLMALAAAAYFLSQPAARTRSAVTETPAAVPEPKTDARAVPQQPLQPPPPAPAPVPAETAGVNKAQSGAAGEKKEAAPDQGQLLAVLDSMRLQHNLDQVSPATAADSGSPAALAYSVQVGAFLVEENAQRRVDQLARKGYTPGITAVKDPQERVWYTVRIGDFASIELARKQADEFAARESRASVVRP
ncbi:MAG: AAA family ATPase, partial [Desulfobacterales bacterium]